MLSLIFSLSMESKFPETFDISFLFLGFSMNIPYPLVILIVLVFYSLVIVANVISYQILYGMRWHDKLINSFEFFLILILKYFIPALLICTLTVDGSSIFEGMPTTSFLLQLFFGLSLLFDWMVFALRFNREASITVKFFKWTLKIPNKRIYKALALLIWSTFSLAMYQRLSKKSTQSYKNIVIK